MLDKTIDKSLDARLGDALSAFVGKSGAIDERTAQTIDSELRSIIASATRGMSPIAILSAYVDWLGHLVVSPGKLLLLQQSLVKKTIALGIRPAMPNDPSVVQQREEYFKKWLSENLERVREGKTPGP